MKRAFMDTLRELEGGCLAEDLTDVQHEIVSAVEEHGGTGELVLKLRYKKDGRQVKVVAAIAQKTPEPERGSTLFFVSPESNLVRQDPNQRAMEVRSVPDETGDRRVLSAD